MVAQCIKIFGISAFCDFFKFNFSNFMNASMKSSADMMEMKIPLLISVFILHCLASSIQFTSWAPESSSSLLISFSLTLDKSSTSSSMLPSFSFLLSESFPFHAEPTSHHLPLSSMFSISSKVTLIGSKFLLWLMEPICFLILIIILVVFSFSMFFNLLFLRSVIVSIKNLLLVEVLIPFRSFSLTDLVSSAIIDVNAVGSSVLSLEPQERISLRRTSVFNSLGSLISLDLMIS